MLPVRQRPIAFTAQAEIYFLNIELSICFFASCNLIFNFLYKY